MAIITLQFTFSVGAVIIAAQHNSNFSTIYSEFNGNIENVNISASAAIDYSKLDLVGTIRQTDLISTFNTAAGFGMVPTGGIIMWSGSIASIPTGWLLCNGSNGTPDLRDRFVVGAGTTYAVDATGGAATVTLTAAESGVPAHTHPLTCYDPGTTAAKVGWGGTASTQTGVTDASVAANASSAHNNLPPYYALAYIMKS